MLHRQVERSRDYGGNLEYDSRYYVCLHNHAHIFASHFDAVTPREGETKGDLPAFPPFRPPSVHVPLVRSDRCGIIEAISMGFAILRVFTYSCRCICELFPRGYSPKGKEEGEFPSAITRLSSNLDVCARFSGVLGYIHAGISAPLPLPDPPTLLVLYPVDTPPPLLSRRLHVGRARISSFLGNHRPEVVGEIISPKSGYAKERGADSPARTEVTYTDFVDDFPRQEGERDEGGGGRDISSPTPTPESLRLRPPTPVVIDVPDNFAHARD